MIRINLLPVRAAQRKEKIRTQVSVLALSTLFVIIVCGAVYMRMDKKISINQAEILAVERESN